MKMSKSNTSSRLREREVGAAILAGDAELGEGLEVRRDQPLAAIEVLEGVARLGVAQRAVAVSPPRCGSRSRALRRLSRRLPEELVDGGSAPLAQADAFSEEKEFPVPLRSACPSPRSRSR